MPETLSIVVSIFGLIGVGYAAARAGFLAPAVSDGLTDFVSKVAIPVLLFQTLVSAETQGLSPWRIWAAYFIPFALIWALAHLIIRGVFGRDARAAVVGGGAAAYSNGIAIGIPLMQTAFGDSGAVFIIVIVSIHLPIMMVGSVLLNEWALRADRVEAHPVPRGMAIRKTALNLATHPVLLAIVVGILWRVGNLPVPALATAILEPLARSAGPLALFASGMVLMNFGVARQVKPALALSSLKLIVMPALVYGAALLIGLPPLGVAVVTLTAACPTGVNVFIMAGQLGTGQALASNTLIMSTAGGVVTVALWLALLQSTLG